MYRWLVLGSAVAVVGLQACTLDFGTFRGNDGSGAAAAGGSAAGGNATGGSATGANATGGTSAGGNATGGTAAGGSATGGSAAGGNATGGAAAGGNGGAAQGGAGGSGGIMCPDDGVAPANVDPGDPWSCNTGQRLCTLDCNGQDECDSSTPAIVCPPGWECRVRCRGDSSCKGNTITCGDYPCTIECDDADACEDTVINCADATCNVQCSDDVTACSGNMEVNCVAGERCNMECTAPAVAPPTVNNCAAACECIEC